MISNSQIIIPIFVNNFLKIPMMCRYEKYSLKSSERDGFLDLTTKTSFPSVEKVSARRILFELSIVKNLKMKDWRAFCNKTFEVKNELELTVTSKIKKLKTNETREDNK